MVPVEIDMTFDGMEPETNTFSRQMQRYGGSGPMLRGRNLHERAELSGDTHKHRWAGTFHGTRGSESESKNVVQRLEAMRDAGMITNAQCVSLATAAVGIRLGGGGEGSHVSSWRRGEGAEKGGLVEGTPIATFLDRRGNTGNTYAIGGNGGQPGAGLDHAAVFQHYIKDKSGKVEGMEVSEQYAGSGGAHSRPYYFKDGGGEHNASNYYAIDVASGGHLGGASNPLTRYHDAAVKAARDAETPSLGR